MIIQGFKQRQVAGKNQDSSSFWVCFEFSIYSEVFSDLGSYFGCAQFLVNALNAVTLASLLTPLAILPHCVQDQKFWPQQIYFLSFFSVRTSGLPALKYELSSWILKFKACGPVNGQKSFEMISGSFDDCKKRRSVHCARFDLLNFFSSKLDEVLIDTRSWLCSEAK